LRILVTEPVGTPLLGSERANLLYIDRLTSGWRLSPGFTCLKDSQEMKKTALEILFQLGEISIFCIFLKYPQ